MLVVLICPLFLLAKWVCEVDPYILASMCLFMAVLFPYKALVLFLPITPSLSKI